MQTQFNAEAKTIANEDAMKWNSKAFCTEQKVKTKSKVNKSKHTRPDKLK